MQRLIKNTLVFIMVWLFALAVLYIVFLKAKYLFYLINK